MSTINLNVSPYFDDFDEKKDYLRVLFRPGFAVQARELTQLQTIAQKQVSRQGNHIFKDGSLMVEESNHGRIILFNNKGDKEWEFVNKDKNGDIGYLTWFRVIENELFIKKFKSIVKKNKC